MEMGGKPDVRPRQLGGGLPRGRAEKSAEGKLLDATGRFHLNDRRRRREAGPTLLETYGKWRTEHLCRSPRERGGGSWRTAWTDLPQGADSGRWLLPRARHGARQPVRSCRRKKSQAALKVVNGPDEPAAAARADATAGGEDGPHPPARTARFFRKMTDEVKAAWR